MTEHFPERIETDRLALERLYLESVDIAALYRIYSAEGIDEVTRYLLWNPHETIEETRAFVDRCETRWESGEAATYLVRPRGEEEGDGEIAGVTELDVDSGHRTAWLDIWLRRRFWGRGYVGERAAALLAVAFCDLDLELVAVTHHTENERSRRAVERYVRAHGGQRDGAVRNWRPAYDGVVTEHRYTITREGYRNAVSDI